MESDQNQYRLRWRQFDRLYRFECRRCRTQRLGVRDNDGQVGGWRCGYCGGFTPDREPTAEQILAGFAAAALAIVLALCLIAAAALIASR
jgi:hypothetical protein